MVILGYCVIIRLLRNVWWFDGLLCIIVRLLGENIIVFNILRMFCGWVNGVWLICVWLVCCVLILIFSSKLWVLLVLVWIWFCMIVWLVFSFISGVLLLMWCDDNVERYFIVLMRFVFFWLLELMKVVVFVVMGILVWI